MDSGSVSAAIRRRRAPGHERTGHDQSLIASYTTMAGPEMQMWSARFRSLHFDLLSDNHKI
jgi:hypothetical protein